MRRRWVLAVLVVVVAAAVLVARWWLLGAEGRLVALRAGDGRLAWTVTVPGMRVQAQVAAGGRVFAWATRPTPPAGDPDGPTRLLALDAASGRRLWTFRLDGGRFPGADLGRSAETRPLVTEDAVYLTVYHRRDLSRQDPSWVVALDPASGAPRWSTSAWPPATRGSSRCSPRPAGGCWCRRTRARRATTASGWSRSTPARAGCSARRRRRPPRRAWTSTSYRC